MMIMIVKLRYIFLFLSLSMWASALIYTDMGINAAVMNVKSGALSMMSITDISVGKPLQLKYFTFHNAEKLNSSSLTTNNNTLVLIPFYQSSAEMLTLNFFQNNVISLNEINNIKWILFTSITSDIQVDQKGEIQFPTPSALQNVAELNCVIRDIKLKHQASYILSLNIEEFDGSVIQVTGSILIDLTPPARWNPLRKLRLAENTLMGITQNFKDHNFTSLQQYDPESGIKKIKIQSFSSNTPFWKDEATGVSENLNDIKWSFHESSESNGTRYRALLQNGSGLWSEPGEEWQIQLSSSGELLQSVFNCPNPFDSRCESTTIYYTLGELAKVKATVYDLTGRPVKSWEFAQGANGGSLLHSISWDGTSEDGKKVCRGVYVLLLDAQTTAGKSLRKTYKIAVIH